MKLTVRHAEDLGDWYVVEFADGGRRCFGGADVEGPAVHMLAIASAIEMRTSASFKRCSVFVEGQTAILCSPRNSTREEAIPYVDALALAAEIRRVCGRVTSAERARHTLCDLQGYSAYSERQEEDDVASVAEAIDAAVAEALPRWVPVGERLPTYDEIVLACTSDGEIFMAEWREHDTDPGGAWWSDDDEIVRVVVWQPLPTPWVAP